MAMAAPPKAFAPTTALQVSAQICEHCLLPPKAPSRLLRCTGCRRVAYCKRACQTSDWNTIHQFLCPQLQKVNTLDKGIDPVPRFTLNEHILHQHLRSLIFAEPMPGAQPIPFPQAYVRDQVTCAVCFHTPFTKPEFTVFHHCPHCKLAWWCSPTCEDDFGTAHTPERCEELALVRCVDRLKIDYAIARQCRRQLMLPTLEPRTTYIPLSSLSGWADYHRLIFPKFDFAAEFTSREFAELNKDVELATRTRAMEAAALPLTVLSALEHALPDLGTRTTLCVHFVGVEQREIGSTGMIEELLHFLPALQSLRVCLVGPNMQPNTGVSANLACARCIARGRTREMAYFQGPYEEYVRTAPARPDLVVALNAGMAETADESWRRAVDVILEGGAPAVFTAYGRAGAEMEERWLRRLGARVTKEVEANKWRGAVPIIDTSNELAGGTTGYNSQYWYMVQGRV